MNVVINALKRVKADGTESYSHVGCDSDEIVRFMMSELAAGCTDSFMMVSKSVDSNEVHPF